MTRALKVQSHHLLVTPCTCTRWGQSVSGLRRWHHDVASPLSIPNLRFRGAIEWRPWSREELHASRALQSSIWVFKRWIKALGICLQIRTEVFEGERETTWWLPSPDTSGVIHLTLFISATRKIFLQIVWQRALLSKKAHYGLNLRRINISSFLV